MSDPSGSGHERDGVWVSRRGTGRPVVLVHGTMDRGTSFGRVARLLSDHLVVTYDRRGYGRSRELGAPRSFDDQVRDLLEVLYDTPAAGDGLPIVFGHSYGGTVAMGASAREPDRIGGLVVYECPMPWMPWWPARSAGAAAVADSADPESAAEAFMIRMIGEERWRRLPPSTKADRRAEGQTLVAELAHVRADDPPFDPSAVRCPMLAVHGSEGAPHHAASIRAIAETAPDARLRVIDGAGHGIHLSDPGSVADLVREIETIVESDH